MFNNPIIIIGMHRSGTSLITQILKRVGVFVGAELNNHEESTFFLKLNQYLFQLAHARWDNPKPLNYLIEALKNNSEFNSELLSWLKKMLISADSKIYWGQGANDTLSKMNLQEFTLTINQPWGWKDPRNSISLPIWLKIFPFAQVVHVYRNAVDVSNSLLIREQKRSNKLTNPIFSCRCLSLEGAFGLWNEYVVSCMDHLKKIPHERKFSLSYEDFLAKPSENMIALCKFLRVPINEENILKAVSSVKPERAFAFLHQLNLKDFYKQIKANPMMETLNYGSMQI